MPEKWTHLISVKSDTSRGTSYGIDVNEDGTLLRCRCAAYIHSKERPKTCKHVERVEVGGALRAFQRKLKPKPSGFRVMGKLAATYYTAGFPYSYRLSGRDLSEPAVVVSEREFRQANAIIEEAWRYASPHSKLRELLDELGRP